MTRLVFPHLRKTASPERFSEELGKAFNLLEPQRFREREIDGCRVGFHSQRTCRTFKKVPIQHKIVCRIGPAGPRTAHTKSSILIAFGLRSAAEYRRPRTLLSYRTRVYQAPAWMAASRPQSRSFHYRQPA